MYIRTALAAALVAMMLAAIPLSADYSGARYQGTIRIDNAGAAAERTAVFLDSNTSGFISDGMLASDYSNAWFTNAGGNSMAFMPIPGTDDWAFFYPWSLSGSSSALSYLYMGGPDMDPPIRYIPGPAGMTTADNASMEPGSNFEIEIKGYVDAAAEGVLVEKPVAFRAVVDSGEVVAQILSAGASSSVTGSVNASGSYTGAFGLIGAVAEWEAIAAEDVKYVVSNNTTMQYGAYSLDITPPGGLAAITSVEVIGRVQKSSASTSHPLHSYGLRLSNGSEERNSPVTRSITSWGVVSQTVPRPGGGNWSWADINGLQVILGLQSNSGFHIHCDHLYVRVNYVSLVVEREVSSPISSGLRTVRVAADGTDLSLYIDGSLVDSAALDGWSVPDNANSWVVAADGSMPYMEYYKHTVGGVLRQHIEWEDATTFTDLSGNSNDATPSFPVASSNPDVTASLISLEPYAAAHAPSAAPGAAGGLAGDLPDAPSGLYAELDLDHIPGAAVVNALLDAGDIPQALFWFPAVFLGIAILCLVVYHYSHSLFAMALVAGAGLVFASRIGIIPWWVTVPLVLIAAAVLVKEKMSPL